MDEEKLLEKTNKEIKKYKILKAAFDKIYDAGTKLSDKRTKAFDSISNLKEDDNSILKDIYKEFTSQMKELEQFRKSQLSIIERTIIPNCKNYPTKANQSKKKISDFKDIKKKNEKQKNEAIKAKSNKELEKSKRLDLEIKSKNEQLIRDSNSIEEEILLFEADRIMDSKNVFLHFIHSELAYHAAALEKLSIIYSKIKEKDPIEDFPNFIDKHGLKSVDPEDFGYNKRKIENRKRKQKQKDDEDSKDKFSELSKSKSKGKKKDDLLSGDEVV